MASGKPVLRLALAHGSGGPKLKSFKVNLPTGFSLVKSKRRQGLSVPGGKVVALSAGQLTVRLNRPANAAHLKLAFPFLVSKKHARKHPTLHVSVTEATGRTTRLSASL